MAETIRLTAGQLGIKDNESVLEFDSTDLFLKAKPAGERVVKRGFSPEMNEFLRIFEHSFGRQSREIAARAIIAQYRETFCSNCPAKSGCSGVEHRRGFCGEIFPEAILKLGKGADTDKFPCFKLGSR